MKQTLMNMMLMLVALTASAQDKKGTALNEKYFDAKVSELVCRLDMTDEQKAKFTPIYRRYNEEIRNTMGPRHKKDADKQHKTVDDKEKKNAADQVQKAKLTDEEKLARTKQRMERQQQLQSIRLKYIDEFSKVLSPAQVNKFLEEEGKIQKKLMERRMHPKGKGKPGDGKHPHKKALKTQ